MSLSKPENILPEQSDFMFLKCRTRSHDDSRKIICAGCHQKKLNCLQVTDNTEKLIQENIYSNYNKSISGLPCGLCESCQRALRRAKTGKVSPEQLKWDSLKWNKLTPPSQTIPCSCSICILGRFTHSNLVK